MARYTQAGRSLTVTTPLGPDVLFLTGFQGYEAVSQMFGYRLDLIAENSSKVEFEKLLGQKITTSLVVPENKVRYFNGICNRISQGERSNVFTAYRMEIVPQVWLLTRVFRSRIFQHLNIPDILKKVLDGLNVTYEIQGTFQPRDYCVQYRESDFSFASRLMEEEGLYYFFKHTADDHVMVVANTAQSHPKMPLSDKVILEGLKGGTRKDDRIFEWEKIQELRSGKYTLWDHCFELPSHKLETEQKIIDSVAAGKVTHKLKVGGNDKLEIYDFPGEYAQRFDGIDKGGAPQPAELQKIFEDNQRTVGIRMQQEALPGLLIQGRSTCRQFVTGHKFQLERHFDADDTYVLTSLEHTAFLSGDYRSGGDEEFTYENRFACIPEALPFRPSRITPKPVVQGSQTGVVVGPPGEEIFTDKYGRVKVQFFWDREGQYNSDSSCWVRVGTAIAGRQWGMIHIPRIGQEVIVDFLEGDPDQPIIVGSVYNADQMPPYTLPDHKTKSCYKSYSSLGGGGFNEIRFEDKKGQEQVFIHAEKDMDVRVKHDRREIVLRDRHLIVDRDKRQLVKNDEQYITNRHRVEEIGVDHSLTVKGKQAVEVHGSRSLVVKSDVIERFQAGHFQEVIGNCVIQGNKVIVEGMSGVCLKVGDSFIKVEAGGVTIDGALVKINCQGSPLSASGPGPVAPSSPAQALIADNADPGDKSPTYKNQPPPSGAQPFNAQSEENRDQTHWIEIELVDEAGNPVPGEAFRITLPDGSVAEGTTDERGIGRVAYFPQGGTCQVSLYNLDTDAWEPA